jgi:rfaE bifunctional protein kinase chain/domain
MTSARIINIVHEKAKSLKAMVIGDAMLDKYIYGTVDRISPEAPVPILSHQRTEVKAGGAANVALNLAAWGCDTILAGVTGNDSNADVLAGLLEKNRIRHHLFISPDRPTTVKTRVVAASHHLLRIDEESDQYLNGQEEDRAIKHLLTHITEERPDLIILEDYNKGFLTEKIIAAVIGKGRELGVFIAVDPKDKNFFMYRGVNLFKPNLREASQAAHQLLTVSDLHRIGKTWRDEMSAETLAITLGANGIFLQHGNEDVHIQPHRAIDVIDVCGAGDAVICALALGIMSGLDLRSCGELANLTGAYVCSHSGVVAVDVETIHHWI